MSQPSTVLPQRSVTILHWDGVDDPDDRCPEVIFGDRRSLLLSRIHEEVDRIERADAFLHRFTVEDQAVILALSWSEKQAVQSAGLYTLELLGYAQDPEMDADIPVITLHAIDPDGPIA